MAELPRYVSVSDMSRYHLMGNGRRPPTTPGFRKVNLNRMAPRNHMEGMGNDPPNQTMVATVHSPALSEFDYYEYIKDTSGIPMFVNCDIKAETHFDDVRVDLCNMNYRFEMSTIRDQGLTERELYDIMGRGVKRKVAAYDPADLAVDENRFPPDRGFAANWPRPPEGDEDQDDDTIPVFDASRGSIVRPSDLWPAAPFRDGRAVGHFDVKTEYEWAAPSSAGWIMDYGDISTDFWRKYRLSGFTVNTVAEFGAGSMSEGEIAHHADVSEHTRTFAMAIGGECDVKNLFSPRLLKGDRCYLLVAPTHVGQLGNRVLRPDGNPSVFPGVMGGECIQLRGVSTGDGFDPDHPMNSSVEAVAERNMDRWGNRSYVGHSNRVEPFATDTTFDRDYVLKSKILKNEGIIFEEDEHGSLIIKRGTDDLEDLPPTILDVYHMGHVIPVGVVLYENRTHINKDVIMEAHRSLKGLRNLPTVRMLML